MYDTNKYGFVEVYMDKHDYALEDLIGSLPYHLYEVTLKADADKVCFKGLMRKSDIQWLEFIVSASPYSNGYDIRIEGYDIYDPKNRRYFWEGYRHWTEIKKSGLG